MEVMDLAMIATLVVSFVLVKLLADWCDARWTNKTVFARKEELLVMIALGIVIIALACYLVYALAPGKVLRHRGGILQCCKSF